MTASPPHSKEAEESALGAILLEPGLVGELNGLIPGDFYVSENQIVFDAIRALSERDRPVDIVTVSDLLRERGDIDKIGGSEYLAHLIDVVPSTSNLSYYADIIADDGRKRRLARAAGAILDRAHSDDSSSDEVAAIAAKLVAEASVGARLTSGGSWVPVDLAGVLSGEREPIRPGMLHRTDGTALVYPGKIHALYGEPEGLKTWLALEACRQVLAAGGAVMFIDYEDTEHELVERLRAFGVADDAIGERFIYLRPVEKVSASWSRVAAVVEKRRPELVVIDGVTEAMTVEGLALEKNADVATFYERLPRPLARLGPGVLTLDHVVKAKDERGRFAIGGQAKLAGLDGASFRLDTSEAFGRGRTGRSKLYVTKDRPGFVSALAVGAKRLLGDVKAVSNADGSTVEVSIEPSAEPGEWKPTVLMERVSGHLVAHPSGLSKRALRDGVNGKASFVDQAIDALISEGYISVDKSGASHVHKLIRSYTADEDQQHMDSAVAALSEELDVDTADDLPDPY